MEFSGKLRIALVVVGGLVILGLAAFEAFGDFDAGVYLERILTAIGGFVAGVGVAGGRRKGAADAATVVILMMALSSSACSGQACQTERTIVANLDTGLNAAAVVVGDQAGDDWDEALGIARGATEIGEEAVRACALARDGAGWRSWVELALRAAGTVASFIDTMAGPEDVAVPPELRGAIGLLEDERARPGLLE